MILFFRSFVRLNNSAFSYIIKDWKYENILKGKTNSEWGFKLLYTIIPIEEDNIGSVLISKKK